MPQDAKDKLLAKLQDLEAGKPTPRVSPGMVVTTTQIIELKVSQVRTAIEATPDHPLAAVFGKAIQKKKDHEVVNVDRVDIQGILENREVEIYDEEEEVGGSLRTCRRKRLGKPLAKSHKIVKRTTRPTEVTTPSPSED